MFWESVVASFVEYVLAIYVGGDNALGEPEGGQKAAVPFGTCMAN